MYLDLAKKYNTLLHKEKCIYLTSGEDGKVNLAIPINSVPESVIKLSLMVKAVGHKDDQETGMEQPVSKYVFKNIFL